MSSGLWDSYANPYQKGLLGRRKGDSPPVAPRRSYISGGGACLGLTKPSPRSSAWHPLLLGAAPVRPGHRLTPFDNLCPLCCRRSSSRSPTALRTHRPPSGPSSFSECPGGKWTSKCCTLTPGLPHSSSVQSVPGISQGCLCWAVLCLHLAWPGELP